MPDFSMLVSCFHVVREEFPSKFWRGKQSESQTSYKVQRSSQNTPKLLRAYGVAQVALFFGTGQPVSLSATGLLCGLP